MAPPLKITIEIIDHSQQRYATCGDWQLTPDGLLITVSKLGDFFQEMCIAVHEFVEAIACIHAGVNQYIVDKFDTEFEINRPSGNKDEPGDSSEAPYHQQHFVATTIERIFAKELGIDWNEYEKNINNLSSCSKPHNNSAKPD